MTRCWNCPPPERDRGQAATAARRWKGNIICAPVQVRTLNDHAVGYDGMRIDRKYFDQFEDRILRDEALKAKVQSGNWHEIETYMEENHYNQPQEFFTREKLRLALQPIDD